MLIKKLARSSAIIIMNNRAIIIMNSRAIINAFSFLHIKGSFFFFHYSLKYYNKQ